QRAKSTKPVRLFTNDDVGGQSLTPEGPGAPVEPASNVAAQASSSAAEECDNPEVAKLREELQATGQELDRARSEFTDGTPVISGNNLDTKACRPGSAGLSVGAPPTSDSAPPVPARLTALQLEQRIADLNKALSIACDSPEAAEIQLK